MESLNIKTMRRNPFYRPSSCSKGNENPEKTTIRVAIGIEVKRVVHSFVLGYLTDTKMFGILKRLERKAAPHRQVDLGGSNLLGLVSAYQKSVAIEQNSEAEAIVAEISRCCGTQLKKDLDSHALHRKHHKVLVDDPADRLASSSLAARSRPADPYPTYQALPSDPTPKAKDGAKRTKGYDEVVNENGSGKKLRTETVGHRTSNEENQTATTPSGGEASSTHDGGNSSHVRPLLPLQFSTGMRRPARYQNPAKQLFPAIDDDDAECMMSITKPSRDLVPIQHAYGDLTAFLHTSKNVIDTLVSSILCKNLMVPSSEVVFSSYVSRSDDDNHDDATVMREMRRRGMVTGKFLIPEDLEDVKKVQSNWRLLVRLANVNADHRWLCNEVRKVMGTRKGNVIGCFLGQNLEKLRHSADVFRHGLKHIEEQELSSSRSPMVETRMAYKRGRILIDETCRLVDAVFRINPGCDISNLQEPTTLLTTFSKLESEFCRRAQLLHTKWQVNVAPVILGFHHGRGPCNRQEPEVLSTLIKQKVKHLDHVHWQQLQAKFPYQTVESLKDIVRRACHISNTGKSGGNNSFLHEVLQGGLVYFLSREVTLLRIEQRDRIVRAYQEAVTRYRRRNESPTAIQNWFR